MKDNNFEKVQNESGDINIDKTEGVSNPKDFEREKD